MKARIKSVIKDKIVNNSQENYEINRHKDSKSLTSKTHKQSKFTKQEKFNWSLYTILSLFLLALVGGINWFVDPLWYRKGNILTGQNFAFNERISKTNLFLRTKDLNYDCLILGSSRVIAIKASRFTNNNCFNYAFKGGEIADFIQYAQFLKNEGLNPQKVYIGVDGFNFIKKDRLAIEPLDISKIATKSPYHAYLSADVFSFSLMTLFGVSPDPANYYDRNFEPEDFENVPEYKPKLHQSAPALECDPSRVKQFASLRKFFPDAEFIGYVPARSPWRVVNDTYRKDLMDCYLSGFYQLSQAYDVMYDFSIPSEITKNTKNTHDGSHFSVQINNQIADVLQGKSTNFGIKLNQYSYEEYNAIYHQKVEEFLKKYGESTN